MSAVAIRAERVGDEPAIHHLTAAAFRDVEHSDGSEPAIVDRLRELGHLALSLVAADGQGAIIGHAAYSPVTIDGKDEAWFGLGPISVAPEHQRRGVGSALIERGTAELREKGARGIVLLGNPAYYSRFGFEHDPRLSYPGPPPEYFQRLVMAGETPAGTVCYSPAFG
ncbi:MAG: N-acetyltransferase [Sphingomonadaceae bacterium]|nr:N-acetyltransferase [Sphingomonadaceae bacterium]